MYREVVWFDLASSFFGGIVIFMMALKQLELLFAQWSSDAKPVLDYAVSTKTRGVVTGFLAAGIFQSSSVVSVLVVSMVSSSLISYSQGLGVLLGAGVGSTLNSHFLAFDFDRYSLSILTLGYLTSAYFPRLDFPGRALQSIGLLFIGTQILTDGLRPLATYPAFLRVIECSSSSLFLSVTAGALVAVLVQSSAASVAIFMSLAAHGALGVWSAIALTLGANVGTCSTALLAAMGKSGAAKRVAVSMVAMRVVGVLFVLVAFRSFCAAVDWVSGEEAAPARKIANANSMLNIITMVLFLPDVSTQMLLRVQRAPSD